MPEFRLLIFIVEIATLSVGSGFHDLHGTRHPFCNSAGDSTDKPTRAFLRRGAPICHFREVRHGDVASARALVVFERADSDDVGAQGTATRVGDAGVGRRPLHRGETKLTHPEHLVGKMHEHLGVHGLDAARRVLGLRHDERVPSLLHKELDPSHIKLGEGAPSPLPRLEQDEAYGLPCPSHPLKLFEQHPLRIVENERLERAGGLVLDMEDGGEGESGVVAHTHHPQQPAEAVMIGALGLHSVLPKEFRHRPSLHHHLVGRLG